MSPNDVKTKRFSTSGARLLLMATLAGSAAVLLSLPVPVTPAGPPPLRFDWPQAADAFADYEALAEGAAPNPELTELLSDYGAAEVGPGETREAYQSRQEAVRNAASALTEAELAGVRAAASIEMVRLVEEGTFTEEDEHLVGAFPRMLERYSVRSNGTWHAHRFVRLALAHARWNGIMELELTSGMSDVMLQAYYGHLALGSQASTERRLEGLAAFEEVGGLDVPEARAWLAYEAGAFSEAATLYQRAAEEAGNLRLRNHALAAELLSSP